MSCRWEGKEFIRFSDIIVLFCFVYHHVRFPTEKHRTYPLVHAGLVSAAEPPVTVEVPADLTVSRMQHIMND